MQRRRRHSEDWELDIIIPEVNPGGSEDDCWNVGSEWVPTGGGEMFRTGIHFSMMTIGHLPRSTDFTRETLGLPQA